ncbi:hypothetical protein N7466_002881 [Penicillium verhagenii]|uniref:uncharacterized protein n=1 Tax=Penicillium verhagenii TaxID=1562060 RepID=UPI002544F892|nr:uncharacterized protein N7466_002881 [Penicillium verhagenii]KAJ5939747.1 hypothetical protein N7466_002881 [Penicillium verhagenii]
MPALKSQSNRPGQQSAFPNDFTNKTTFENDRRRREAIAAAKLHDAQAAEALERERREKEEAAALKINELEQKKLELEQQKAEVERQKLEIERTRDDWIQKFNTTSAASDERIRQLTRDLEDQRNQKDAQIHQLNEDRRNLDYKVIDELPNEDVQIFAVTYGSRIYYDSGTQDFKNMVPHFKDYARSGHTFRVCNELLNDDPNPNHFKSLIIVYRYNRPGTHRRIRTLTGWEGHDATFDSW